MTGPLLARCTLLASQHQLRSGLNMVTISSCATDRSTLSMLPDSESTWCWLLSGGLSHPL
jgi:hypothetical protein